MQPEAVPLLYRELVRIAAHLAWTPREKVLALTALLENVFVEATKREQLAFSTLFARISYAGHLFHIQPDTLRVIHTFRRLAMRVRHGHDGGSGRLVRLGVKALAETLLIIGKTAIPPEVLEHLPAEDEWRFSPPDIWDYKACARVVAVRDEPDNNFFWAYDEENPEHPVRVRYNLPERNDNFNPTIRLLRTVFGFPVTLNLLEVDIDREGDYRPRLFVVEPDYLMDVTAVAECFKDNGAQPLAYLVKKFLPYEVTPAILLGNIANFFLDRLLTEPDAAYQDLLRETFRLFPFVYAPMSDSAVREISNKAQKHYVNLKSMAHQGFAQQNIEPENCILEPTFYSEQYGLQGRLDLFYHTAERAAIVELKSGTPFRPNAYGIQRSHFTQTLLYDLLVRSVFGPQTDPAKYILYSGADVQQLRFAPTVAPEQWEALQVRNQLVAIERLLANIRPGDETAPLLERLRAGNADSRDFLARDFGLFEAAYAKLSPVEKKYFNAFAGFIAREQWLAKVGDENADSLNGNAALWRGSFAEKQEAFALLSHLEIVENHANEPDPYIVFRKTENTSPLANFRTGDIAVLYPAETETATVLDHQVIKCTITELGKERITVQLRYRQFNLKPFDTDSLWNLEPDMLDTGFLTMYRGLFEWAGAGNETRGRVLNPTPNPSPEGEGDLIPIIGSTAISIEESGEITQANLPLKPGSFGQPEETTNLKNWSYLKNMVRQLRKFQTPAENVMWEELRNRRFKGLKFRRQHAIDDYIVDFVCLELRLVVEIDGNIHDYQPEYDQLRTDYLKVFGFEVVRFQNTDVLNRMESVLSKLIVLIKKRQAELEKVEVKSISISKISETIPSSSYPRPEITRDQAPLPPGGGVGGGVDTPGEQFSPNLMAMAAGGGALTPDQSNLLNKITASPHFFLLWGPPGTGKTSVMLRALVDWVLKETDDNLLLLAYTNRAVDEICESLESLGGDIREQYLRIGSRFSTAERFRDRLLSARIAGVNTRAELRAVLEPCRIFASTVASFAQNDKLLEIKKFQRLIVDEASQILEPQLIGLLTRFEHFVLIGDHRQLPAVTTQRPEQTIVTDPDLNAIGLTDLRDSYFERLYRLCVSENMHEHYGRLSRQGRMHADIMYFPNRHFYGGFLQTLAGDEPDEGHFQHRGLERETPPRPSPKGEGDVECAASPSPSGEGQGGVSRVLFLPVISPNALPNQKTAPAEAEMAARLVAFFKDVYVREGRPWRPDQSLGIITPWRAQIAQLRETLAAEGLDPDEITIDTVERYQGGARDIILISCCVHSVSQLNNLVNLSGEGVDRKLNVALTRARGQVIVLGNPEVLREDPRYREFMERYGAGL
ncbi:MAG: DUF559 domain-containing protein [Thermoanaerobaculia bacterium]|nr:DUF559 domain-containing protein [Thermoanaerobaculia bacterium]